MEDRISSAKHFVQEQQKVNSAAEWEEKAQQRGDRMDRAREEEERQAAKQADLERRSALLAKKLREEELEIQEMLLKKQQEVVQRRLDSVDKAHERSAMREAERRRLVDQLSELQFRESCDAVRSRQSHARQQQCIEAQKQQAEERQIRRKQDQAADRAIDQQAQAADLKNLLEYQNSMAEKRKKYLEIKGLLDEQVEKRELSKEQEAARQLQESMELQRRWEAEQAAEQAAAKEQAMLRQLSHVELQSLTRKRQEEKAAMLAKEKEADKRLVQDVLRQESKAQQQEQLAKQQARLAALQHRKALEAMLSQEVEQNNEADELIDRASRAQQAREDSQKAAAGAARAKLMAEVNKTRLEQIHQRALSRDQLVGERQAELERLERQNAEAAECEAKEAERLRQTEIQYRAELQAQMAAKQQAEARERAQAALEVQQAKQAEEEYQKKLAAVLNESRPQTDFRRKRIDWFS